MKLGPQIECRGCGLPVLLAFTSREGADRSLRCPYCEHTHHWVVTDVTVRPVVHDGTSTRSSVE